MESKETETALKAIVKSSVFVFVFLIFSKILTYFYRIIIARYFGPEIYGSLSLAIMISGFFILFSVLGFDEGILRYISFYRGKKQNKKISVVFNFAHKISILIGLILGGIMFVSSEFIATVFFHNPSLTIFFQIFSISVPISAITRIYLATIRAFEKIGWYSFLTNFVEGFFKLIFLIIFIFVGIGSLSVHLSYVIGTLSMLIGAYFVFSFIIKITPIKTKKSKKIKKELFSYSWPLMFVYIFANLYSWIDVFVIGYFKSTSDVGLYSAAVPIAVLILFVPNLFMQLFAPLINRNYAQKKSHLIKDLSQQIGKWTFTLNLPIIIILILFPGVIINFLFGSEYSPAAIPLIFLTIGYLFYSQFIPSFNLLNMMKKSKLSLFNIIISSIFNLILNFILVPIYGINGAAVATMISLIFFTSLTALEAYYFSGIFPIRRKMLNILVIGIISKLDYFSF